MKSLGHLCGSVFPFPVWEFPLPVLPQSLNINSKITIRWGMGAGAHFLTHCFSFYISSQCLTSQLLSCLAQGHGWIRRTEPRCPGPGLREGWQPLAKVLPLLAGLGRCQYGCTSLSTAPHRRPSGSYSHQARIGKWQKPQTSLVWGLGPFTSPGVPPRAQQPAFSFDHLGPTLYNDKNNNQIAFPWRVLSAQIFWEYVGTNSRGRAGGGSEIWPRTRDLLAISIFFH